MLIKIAYAICCIRINPVEMFPKQTISQKKCLMKKEDMRTTTTTTQQNVKAKKNKEKLREREREKGTPTTTTRSTTQESKAKATTTQQHKTQFLYLEINTHNTFLLLLAAACLLLHTSTRWGHRSKAGLFSVSVSLSLSHHSSVRLSSPLLSSQERYSELLTCFFVLRAASSNLS